MNAVQEESESLLTIYRDQEHEEILYNTDSASLFSDHDKLKSIKLMNDQYCMLQEKYGYLLHGNIYSRTKKLWDIISAVLVFLFVLLPLIIFWAILILTLYSFYAATFKFRTYSFNEYFKLFLGNNRLYLLQFENKANPNIWYHFLNRIIGFAQIIEFFSLYGEWKNNLAGGMMKYAELFGGKAYPYLFTVVTRDYKQTHELVHKYHTKGRCIDSPIFRDRECFIFASLETSSDAISYGGIPHMFSIADYRHKITRDIAYICLNVETPQTEFYDLAKYEKQKFVSIPQDYMVENFKYPYCKRYCRALHYGPLLWRTFGIKLTKTELEWLNDNLPPTVFLATPDWFNFILFNNLILKKVYKVIHSLAVIVKQRTTNNILQKLQKYARDNNLNEMAVLYCAVLQFIYTGGWMFPVTVIDRFKSDPEKEYNLYMNNKTNYVLEVCRLHASIARATTHLSHKEYTLSVNGKLISFPKGTPISAELIEVNDNINSPCPAQFNPNRSRNAYHETFTFHAKDGLFFNKNNKMLPLRFCPGRIVIEPHFIEICDRLFENLTDAFKFKMQQNEQSNDLQIDTAKVHKSLSFYNKTVINMLASGIQAHNKKVENEYIPKVVLNDDDLKQEYPTKIDKDSVFSISIPKNDEYVERVFIKDFVFKIITSLKCIFPVQDDAELFDNSSIDNAAKIAKRYLCEKAEMPKVNTLWTELKSDYAISLFAFGSAACFYTKKYVADEFKINNAEYMSDVTYLSKYEVRNGLHRYGACAYFDKSYKLLAIYVSHLQKLCFVDDDEDDQLQYAKYVWITCILSSMTIKEHAIYLHLVEANAFVTHSVEQLPNTHWLKRLLLIFTYRSIYINQSLAKVILIENGMLHRIVGFTANSFHKLCQDVITEYKYVPFTQRYHVSMKDLDDKIFPIIVDSKEYYDIQYKFVSKYVDSYFNKMDSFTKQYFENVCKDLKIEKMDFNQINLCKLLTNLICSVTAYHKQVGGIMDYINRELDWHDSKLYKNKSNHCSQSKNDFVSCAMLVMLTGVKTPKIINDFKHILLDDDKLENNQKLFDEWQISLKLLSKSINERNKYRRIPFNSYNPMNMECSASI